MSGWSIHKGTACCLMLDNIDTDQLLPARFMSQPRSDGYGSFLLHDLRRDSEGIADTNFPLNRHVGISILLSGRNFGCGSSREAAVYALIDAGIQVVIAPSFGDIFAANAINNGLLPAVVNRADHDRLIHLLSGESTPATANLNTSCISIKELEIEFQLDESWRTKLINGWDDIDLTGKFSQDIARFKQERQTASSWAWPTLGS